MDLPAAEQVLPAEGPLQVIEGSPISFTIELVPESEPNEGLEAAEANAQAKDDQAVGQLDDQAIVQAVGQLGDQPVGQLGDQAVGQLGDQAVVQLGDQAVVQPRDQAEVKRLVDQALIYFRSVYIKDGQLVSFSFLVSRA